MADRLKLQEELEEFLNSKNVYYQPPATIKMVYPAIVYSKSNIMTRYADNNVYTNMDCYEVIVIDKKPDNPVIKTILQHPYYICSYDRHYVSDNLHHDVLTIYY